MVHGNEVSNGVRTCVSPLFPLYRFTSKIAELLIECGSIKALGHATCLASEATVLINSAILRQ